MTSLHNLAKPASGLTLRHYTKGFQDPGVPFPRNQAMTITSLPFFGGQSANFEPKGSFWDPISRVWSALQTGHTLDDQTEKLPFSTLLWAKERLQQTKTFQPDLFQIENKPNGQAYSRKQRRWILLGDAGSGTQTQWSIGQQLFQRYLKDPYSAVLVLGDNVYEYGESRFFLPRIFSPYAELYRHGVKFFPVLGNHDVRNGEQHQQLQFWGSPSFYNIRQGEVEVFALDTTVFLPGLDGLYQNDVSFAHKKREIQLTWLEGALAKSSAPIKIVMGHYPLQSSGQHGIGESRFYEALKAILQPLLDRYGVNLYVSGHEHLFEVSEPQIKSSTDSPLTTLISGGGGKRSWFYRPVPNYPRHALYLGSHWTELTLENQGTLRYEVFSTNGHSVRRGSIPTSKTHSLPFTA